MDKTVKIENSTGVYEADNDAFFSSGNSNRPVEDSEMPIDLKETTEAMEKSEKDTASQSLIVPSTSSTTQIHSSEAVDVLPFKIFKPEDICQASDTENWSLIGCYDVEESGALVPLIKDQHEDVLFEEPF
ncbi:hypothetical protein WA026_008355 [Henosepilachna vigintioctopunctata]|uniref:Uncharacterized protein n=1 Tax=Henosepilachna vigintioctopunctata TaxID=420089 RepID=A0AAW1U8C0_9CUCU